MTIDTNELKARTDLVSVVGSFVQLRKKGAEYLGVCPFHDDSNPSFWVIPQKGFCHCFSCGANHDAISFLQEIEGIDFKAACERLGAKTDWTPKPAAPVKKREPLPERITEKPPAGTPTPDMALRELGQPSRIWPYRDADGAILMYVARYETPTGKQIRCWTWGRRGERPFGWGCGHWSGERPLYGLDKLAARPDAPVLVVEGEKAAEAAQELLGAYVVVTWPAGSQSWHKANWRPLAGRSVLLWPDNDEPGLECMEKLAAILADPRGTACSVSLLKPSSVPPGFDAADWTGTADELIAWAKPRKREYTPPQPAAPKPPPPKERPRLAVVAGNTALAPVEEPEAVPAPLSEDALADHFAEVHSPRWRYVKVWGSWYEWQGDGWHKDETAKIDRLAVEVTRQALNWQEAASLTPDGKRKVNSKRYAGNLRDIALNDRRIAATVDQWDRDPWLLGVPGGVVDLRLGKLLEADPEQYITKRTAVAPEPGDCPAWTGLLARVTRGDDSLLQYLQRFSGYILTGETREECFAFVYGPAQTGKSTFVRVLQEILGDYHRKASMETFTETRHERHAEELAVLAGARLVTSVETEEGRRWNESRIKALTGRDRIRARFMRENSFEFDPQFKLLIAGNHAPHLRNVDEAMRRRLHIIPFTDPIPMEERDDTLSEKLRAEYPQILAWMIRGALDWQAYKLGRPDQIAQAVDDYLESEDTFGEWLNECTTRDKAGSCQSGGAYRNYKTWADAAGEYAYSQKRFVQALKERGFETRKGAKGMRLILGLSLRETEAPPFGRYPDD